MTMLGAKPRTQIKVIPQGNCFDSKSVATNY